MKDTYKTSYKTSKNKGAFMQAIYKQNVNEV